VQRNSKQTHRSGHATRSGPVIKNGRSSAKDGALERLRCETIQKEVSWILQFMSAGAARTNSPSILSCIISKRKKKAVAMTAKSEQLTAGEAGNGQLF